MRRQVLGFDRATPASSTSARPLGPPALIRGQERHARAGRGVDLASVLLETPKLKPGSAAASPVVCVTLEACDREVDDRARDVRRRLLLGRPSLRGDVRGHASGRRKVCLFLDTLFCQQDLILPKVAEEKVQRHDDTVLLDVGPGCEREGLQLVAHDLPLQDRVRPLGINHFESAVRGECIHHGARDDVLEARFRGLVHEDGHRDRFDMLGEIAPDGIPTASGHPAEQKRYCREPEAHPIPSHSGRILEPLRRVDSSTTASGSTSCGCVQAIYNMPALEWLMADPTGRDSKVHESSAGMPVLGEGAAVHVGHFTGSTAGGVGPQRLRVP